MIPEGGDCWLISACLSAALPLRVPWETQGPGVGPGPRCFHSCGQGVRGHHGDREGPIVRRDGRGGDRGRSEDAENEMD